MYSHLGAARHVIKRLGATLHVIAVVFNPLRFQSRYNLFREFERHAIAAGVELWVAELAFGDRPFEVTEAFNPRHIQLRTDQELWHKERLINVAVSRLPQNWEYVAWVDADVTFANPDWPHETLQQLQHFPVVQMFTHAIDMGPNFEPMFSYESFAASHIAGKEFPKYIKKIGGAKPALTYNAATYTGKYIWHPGYAWAYRREAWDQIGGLLDISIIGASDHQMAYGLIGEINEVLPKETSAQYCSMIKAWEANAAPLKRDIGVMPGTLLHHFHGPKPARGYETRWKILTDNRFNPVTDLKNDWQGLFALTGNKIKLRDDLRRYFRGRNEDSVAQ